MKSKEIFEKIVTDHPEITIKLSQIKKFTSAQWTKANKQYEEMSTLERAIRMEKVEAKERAKRYFNR